MAERRLLNDLMEYYQKLERPVANESEAVQLKERRLCSTHYLILSEYRGKPTLSLLQSISVSEYCLVCQLYFLAKFSFYLPTILPSFQKKYGLSLILQFIILIITPYNYFPTKIEDLLSAAFLLRLLSPTLHFVAALV